MTKRRHPVDLKHLTCVEEYDFTNKNYATVTKPDDLIGGETILTNLSHEITFPLSNPDHFELFSGTLPVNRFLRFFGVKHSSKRTTTLSFACGQSIYTSVIRSVLEFKPVRDLPRLMNVHKQRGDASLIVLSNVEDLFIPKQHTFEEINNCKMLAKCIREIEEYYLPIWIVFLTTSKTAFLFDIDTHFSQHTWWSGIVSPGIELFTIVERMQMITICIKKYNNNSEKFPWPHLSELREFTEKHTSYCTFNEINAFVKRVFNFKRRGFCETRSSVNSLDDLIPEIDDYYRCLYREGSSIVAYAALDENINVYCQ